MSKQRVAFEWIKLRLLIEISTILVSFSLIFQVIMRLPKEIIGLLDSRSKTIFSQRSINTKIFLSLIYLILILIFLNIMN